ncbi:MAG TPA: hypothetical protein VH815_15660, partial [Acidobacteriota bacterium]
MSGCLSVCLLIAFAASFFIYLFSLKSKILYRDFNLFIERFGGSVSPQGFLNRLPYFNTTYNRRPLRISLYQTPGKHKKTYSRFHMNVSDPVFEFVVTRQALLNNIGKFLGMQDIEIGDEAFDKAFIIKTNSRERFIEIFNFEIREHLISNESGAGGTLQLSHGKLHYEKVGSFGSRTFNDQFAAMIEIGAKIAERIDARPAQLENPVAEIPAPPINAKVATQPRPKWNDWPEDEEYLKRLARDLIGGKYKKEEDRCLYVVQYRRRELVLEYFYNSDPRILNISLTVTQKFWLRMLVQMGEDTADEIRVSDPLIDKNYR